MNIIDNKTIRGILQSIFLILLVALPSFLNGIFNILMDLGTVREDITFFILFIFVSFVYTVMLVYYIDLLISNILAVRLLRYIVFFLGIVAIVSGIMNIYMFGSLYFPDFLDHDLYHTIEGVLGVSDDVIYVVLLYKLINVNSSRNRINYSMSVLVPNEAWVAVSDLIKAAVKKRDAEKIKEK